MFPPRNSQPAVLRIDGRTDERTRELTVCSPLSASEAVDRCRRVRFAGTTAYESRQLTDLNFSSPDYVIFAISLGLPLCIGVLFFICGRSQQTTESFLVGDRSLNVVPVATSLIASVLNGKTANCNTIG